MTFSAYEICGVTLGGLNPLSANPTKWSHILKQFVGKLQTNCLNVFYHFVGLALKGLVFTWVPSTAPKHWGKP